MEPSGSIPAKSERQAMDWSLVLVSQGIETTIERNPDSEAWSLSVPSQDYTRAIQALRQYHVENKRGAWIRDIGSGLLLDARVVAWAVVVMTIYLVNAAGEGRWQSAGVMSNHLVREGEWWRLFTAVTLHADSGHLALNLTTGLLLVGLAMGTFGPGLGLLLATLAGAGGNLAGLLVYTSTHQSLGASGVVMGALGLTTVHSISSWRDAGRGLIVRALCGGFLLLVLLGFSPDPRTDVVAHLGGFASGVALGILWAAISERRNVVVDIAALIGFALLTVGPWALALRGTL